MTIEWTETARQDLREIRRFIARDSKKYAARMIARIREAAGGRGWSGFGRNPGWW